MEKLRKMAENFVEKEHIICRVAEVVGLLCK